MERSRQQEIGESSAATLARARSYVYGLLAAAVGYPNVGLLSSLRAVSVHLVAPLGGFLCEQVAALRDAAASAAVTELAETYGVRVGHAVRGACPPYELEYGGRGIIQQAGQLADVAGFYEAHGLTVGGLVHDRPDHFSTECEFMQVLTAKEARAIEQGDDGHLQLGRDTQAAFLEAHWAQWVPAFAHRLIEANADDFYGRVGRCIEAFVAIECEAFGVEAGPAYLELKPPDPEADTTINCGAADCPARAIMAHASGASDRSAPDTSDGA